MSARMSAALAMASARLIRTASGSLLRLLRSVLRLVRRLRARRLGQLGEGLLLDLLVERPIDPALGRSPTVDRDAVDRTARLDLGGADPALP